MTTRRATVTPIKKRRSYKDDELAGLLTEKLQELPDNFLMCRDMRHAWNLEVDFYVEPARNSRVKGDIKRTLVCLRCEMTRVERYSQTRWGLEKVGQSYHAPDGYAITGLPRGNKPSSIVQGEQYRRAMEKVAKTQRGRRKHA